MSVLPHWPLILVAVSASVQAGTIVEDFSTIDHADLSATTGIWNVGAHEARVQAFAGGQSGRPMGFGDGSDGALSSSSGVYTFDTDAHPMGFNFTSVSITGGTIQVRGSHPLVIRALGPVTLVPTLPVYSVSSHNGGTAVADVGTSSTGGQAVTCGATGGAGGAATATTAADGDYGLQSDSSPETGRNGTGVKGSRSGVVDALTSFTGPASNDFDDPTNFICGTGGSGGGAFADNAVHFASGAGGGAGGGRVRIAAAGDLTVGAIEALGGDGGVGASMTGGFCSGNGAGGGGGVVWLQTLGTLTGAAPLVTAGTGGDATSIGCFSGSGPALDGFIRGDSAPSSRPGWATGDFDTDQVPASTQAVIVSKGYDLGTYDASFPNAAAITQTLNNGHALYEYAGSADNSTFSGYTTDLSSLSGKGYRYVKFRITLTSDISVTASPVVSRIALSYEDLGPTPPDSIGLKLAAGCGTIRSAGGPGGPGNRADSLSTLFWAVLALSYYGVVRITREVEV